MLVDLSRYPYAVRVASDLLVAVRFSAAGKYHYLFAALHRFNKQTRVPFMLSPSASASEYVLKPKSVAVADVSQCRRQRRSRCQM